MGGDKEATEHTQTAALEKAFGWIEAQAVESLHSTNVHTIPGDTKNKTAQRLEKVETPLLVLY